jgi:hypothetical protein
VQVRFQLIALLFAVGDDSDIINAMQFAIIGDFHVNTAPPGRPGSGGAASVVWDGVQGDTWPGEL